MATQLDKQTNSFLDLGFVSGVNEFARKVIGVGPDGSLANTSIGGYSFTQLLGDWPMLAVGNKIEATYPSATTEEFSFTSIADGEVLRLRVTYTNSTKDVFSSVERTV